MSVATGVWLMEFIEREAGAGVVDETSSRRCSPEATTRQVALTRRCVSRRLKWRPQLEQTPRAHGATAFLARKAE